MHLLFLFYFVLLLLRVAVDDTAQRLKMATMTFFFFPQFSSFSAPFCSERLERFLSRCDTQKNVSPARHKQNEAAFHFFPFFWVRKQILFTGSRFFFFFFFFFFPFSTGWHRNVQPSSCSDPKNLTTDWRTKLGQNWDGDRRVKVSLLFN